MPELTFDEDDVQSMLHDVADDFGEKIARGELDLDEKDTQTVYIVWDTKVNSWNDDPQVKSIHLTLDGAVCAVPESVLDVAITIGMDPDTKWVKVSSNFAIEEREIGE